MAKQKRALPARKRRDRSRDDESLLLRSAESLGRVIGALQRQLDDATRRLSATRRGTKKRSATPRRASAKKTESAARKPKGSAARKKTKKR